MATWEKFTLLFLLWGALDDNLVCLAPRLCLLLLFDHARSIVLRGSPDLFDDVLSLPSELADLFLDILDSFLRLRIPMGLRPSPVTMGDHPLPFLLFLEDLVLKQMCVQL